MIYFDATGSLLRRQKNGKDYQIHTILVLLGSSITTSSKKSSTTGVSLPVVSNVTLQHEHLMTVSVLGTS